MSGGFARSAKNISRHKKGFSVRPVVFVIGLAATFALLSFALPDFFSVSYSSSATSTGQVAAVAAPTSGISVPISGDSSAVSSTSSSSVPVTHIKPPAALKALYMTSWVAGTPSLEKHIENLLTTTEANAVVIDIKDYTGDISFETDDQALNGSGCIDKRIPDINALVSDLHAKGIYVIGRIAVFQDPCFVGYHPELGLRRLDNGQIWKDDKGLSWLDPSKAGVADYVAQISHAAYDAGFDEINLDYVRFPSDGSTNNIAYPTVNGTTSKPLIMKSFFEAINKDLRPTGSGDGTSAGSDPAFATLQQTIYDLSKTEAGRMVVSADVFGQTTVTDNGLGIGQVLGDILPYVDYVDPMVYPSHFINGFDGFKNPAEDPYQVIKYSMGTATTTTAAMGLDIQKLRPWLQYFNLGAVYTSDMIRAQIQATYDVGLKGWLLWDPNNKYAAGGLLPK